MQVNTPATNRRGIMTRRSLLWRGSCAILAAMFPPGSSFAAEPAGPVMVKLSAYMSAARDRSLPEDVAEKVKLHILDTLSAMISGSGLVPGQAAIEFVRAYGGERVSTVVGSNIVCGPIEAALANGVLAHSDETDDSHAPSQSHPGCAVIPAAWAVGEKFGIAGTHLLRAVALGYDIGPRMTMTLGALNFQSEGHKSSHSVAGGFGAAAAAGCAANLNNQQMRWLMDYAAQQSSGIFAWQRDTEHVEKAFVFAGMPARSGTTAALLVQAGWVGIDDIFSGADNFFLAYSPKSDPAGLIEKLGERYEVTRTNIKKWCVGSPIQAPLDALEILRKRHPFEPDEVQQVTVRLAISEATNVDNSSMPDVCLQHMIAVMLIDKGVSFRAAHDRQRMHDPAIRRQRAKVKLVTDEDLEKRLPAREAIVEVTLADGTRLREHVTAVRGTAENPMTRDDVIAKSQTLIAPMIGEARCAKVIEKVFGLDNVTDIRELRPLISKT